MESALLVTAFFFTFFFYQAITLDTERTPTRNDKIFMLWATSGLFLNPLLAIVGKVFDPYMAHSLIILLFYDFVLPVIGVVILFSLSIFGSDKDSEGEESKDKENNNNE